MLGNGMVAYDDGKLTYQIENGEAIINGISSQSPSLSLSIPESALDIPIKGIATAAFEGNDSVKKINFRKSITIIHDRLCKNCTNLEGFQLGEATAEIGEEAFCGCVSLTAAVMKHSTKKICSKAFYGCANLRSVKLPAGISEIAEDAFEDCPKVTFYCEPGSYAEQYAKEHGFRVITMDLTE